jgi:microcystin-dependent protein
MNRIYRYAWMIALMGVSSLALGQANVGIGTTDPHPSAILHVDAPDGKKGILIPFMDWNTREGIKSTAAEGLLVYDKNINKFCFYDGAAWRTVNQMVQPAGSTVTDNSTHSGDLSVTGTFSATDYVLNNTSGNGVVPKGGIIMWNGTVVPPGWALCDGQAGRPDLRERFIVGSGGDNPTVSGGGYNLGDRAGEVTHTLTSSEMPRHNHTTGTDGAHTHTYNAPITDGAHPGGHDGYDRPNGLETGTTSTTGSAHSHFIAFTGGDQPHENRPPYYALAFIIKL